MSDSVWIYDHDGLEKGFEKLIQREAFWPEEILKVG